MDVHIDSSAIDELFAPFVTEFDAQTNQASPSSYPSLVMDRSPLEACETNVWDELNSIEPLMLDLPMDTNHSSYGGQLSVDYDHFPESLGPKMTAIYEPLYDASSPQVKEGSAYSPRHDQRNRLSTSSARVGRNNNKSKVIRTKCPVFPESSTPLSELTGKSYSCSSLSSKCSTVMSSDGSYPGTFASDPGHCEVSDAARGNSTDDNIQQFIAEVLKPRKKLHLVDQEDEFEKSSSQSPVAFCESPIPSMPPSTTKSALKIEMPIRYVKKITDLDRKILKLQAERAKLLEKGQSKVDDLENSFESRRGSVDFKSSVQVHYYAVGIPELDGACYNEGNLLLTSIGGINNDYKVAVETLCEACNEKKSSDNVSQCLAHMKTLLVGHQSLKLHQMEGGLYQLLVQPNDPQMICHDLSQALAVANKLLKITQQIVGSSTIVENRLKIVIETVCQLVTGCEATCDHLGIIDERKVQIKNVLEGNQIALETALRLWPKSCMSAKNTLQAITNSMHPIYNGM